MVRSIAIFSKDSNARTREGAGRVIDECLQRGISILIHQRCDEPHASHSGRKGVLYFKDFSEVTNLPDMVFSVGGDGTFLETIIQVKDYRLPIAGVNTGRMGFLANISPDEISHSFDLLCRDEYDIIERSLLQLMSPESLFEGNNMFAMNEITIQKSELSMITISVYVDGNFLNTYWSDGLIFSTATGSTAYNLSVGGPILSPEDESIIISPIAPHNLSIRPIIISGNCILRMVIEGRSHEFMTTVDFRAKKVPFGQEVQLRRAPVTIKTIRLKGRDFYSTLRSKLMWGADRRN